MNMPYLDHAATTPVDARVIERMLSLLGADGIFGNPSSLHRYGRQASAVVEQARAQVARALGADPREIILTSGATESNNLAILGLLANKPRAHVVTSAIEHHAVLDVCAHWQQQGGAVTYVPPNADGQVEAEAIARAIQPETGLVSVMHANNETGVINPIAEIGEVCRARGVAFHVDAAQSFGKLALDMKTLAVDLLSISAHKFYGPKGIGALYVRRRAGLDLQPRVHGGGQERGLRSGTLATHQIAGMGLAAEIALAERESDHARIAALRDQLWDGIAAIGGVTRNGNARACLPGHLNVCVDGVKAHLLLPALARIAVSSGSACTAGATAPSHVLTAMGLSVDAAHRSLRFSLGRTTTASDITEAIGVFAEAVQRLRA
ncbi:cysteine desulfurase family protein [Sinimarinibacterium sp. NLF-5-8]|uniref:cysteine desulfurase family protein n=1 Tax=Sinimarinibacterium sp. NLF-5-8 TaxID=2698684 RepID=UPI00137BF9B7|nr:cysteine desulfurase family protein [Sinimarinibacterium sp. NLF-5-8]QHS09897.1 cysteine desulfurase [Sinimarinibacterium sp. NLF-5-8]